MKHRIPNEITFLVLSVSYYLFFSSVNDYPIFNATMGFLLDYLVIKIFFTFIAFRYYLLNIIASVLFIIFLLVSFYIHYTLGTFINIDLFLLFFYQPIQIVQHAISISPISLAYALVCIIFLCLFNHILAVKNISVSDKTNKKIVLSLLILTLLPNLFSKTYTNNYYFNMEKMFFLSPYQYLTSEAQKNFSPIFSLITSSIQRLKIHDYEYDRDNFVYTNISSKVEYNSKITSSKLNQLNVILVIVESLRPDQLSQYGSKRLVMPALEGLASRSSVFLNAYSQASHSDLADICPLSSHYPMRSKQQFYYSKTATYPRVVVFDALKKVGYRTAVFSSQNETWAGMLNYYLNDNLDHLFHAETYRKSKQIDSPDEVFHDYMQTLNRAGKVDDRVTVKKAIDWIGSQNSAPFFMYMNLQSGHFPYKLPQDHTKRFNLHQEKFEMHFGRFPKERMEEVKEYYAESLYYVDLQLKRLFDFLVESNQLDNTIIIVTADTGQGFYEHGLTQHGNSVYDELVRVPIIVFTPEQEGKIWNNVVEHIDIPPTIYDLLNLAPHPGFQGTSMFRRDAKQPVFSICTTGLSLSFAVRIGNYKYIYDESNDREMLFNISLDPHEKINIVDQHKDLKNKYSTILYQWINAHLDYYSDLRLHSKFYPPKINMTRFAESKP